MSFINLSDCPVLQPVPGVRMQTPHGEHLMLSRVEIDEGCEVPLHSHPHEQGGMLLSGTMKLTVGSETRVCKPGDMYLIPGGIEHRAVAIGGPVVALDVFSPVREDYASESSSYFGKKSES